MTLATTLEQAETGRVRHYANGVRMVDLLGDFETDDGGPLAFLINNPPEHTLQAHFHPSDQFQIFVQGTAKLGRHPIHVGTVHYSDAYTPYGPIVPVSADGYSYFTLRPKWTPLTHWVPEEILLAKGKKGRNLTAEPDLSAAPGAVDLIQQPDGVAVTSIIATAAEKIDIAAGEAGYYCVVLKGEVELEDCSYPPLSCIWSDGPGLSLTAGTEGAAILITRFGDRSRIRP